MQRGGQMEKYLPQIFDLGGVISIAAFDGYSI
jgi:hypothetical protein